MADGNAAIEQIPFEGETAAEQKGDQVVREMVAEVIDFACEFAVTVDAVTGNLGADVGIGSGERRRGDAAFANVDDRAGLLVARAEEEKIESVFFRQDDEVGLRIPRSQSRSRFSPFAAGNRGTYPVGCVGVHVDFS